MNRILLMEDNEQLQKYIGDFLNARAPHWKNIHPPPLQNADCTRID